MSTVIRTGSVWILLGVALVALVRFELRLDRLESSARESRDRIGRLIRSEERERLSVAMIRVAPFEGPAHLFAPTQGIWRCPSHFNAIASAEAVNALLKSLLEAEGVIQSRSSQRALEYGFDRKESVTVSLLGAAGEAQLQLDLGSRLPDLGGCYVRRADRQGIWSIDTDPWQALGIDPTGRRPPLLDPHVIPRIWPGKSRKIDRVLIEVAGRPRLELTLEEIEISEQEMRSGKLPYIWHLAVDGEPREASTTNVMQYTSFLLRIPFTRALDPASGREFGFDQGASRVVLIPAEGQPAELRLGSALPTGGLPLVNRRMLTLFEVPPEVARLVIPEAQLLASGAPTSPWEKWLRRE